jgi:hypothetical protein
VSEENADLLKRAVDAHNRRDVEALLEELDPEIEWHTALPGLLAAEATVYRAHEGIGEMFRDLFEVLDEVHFEYPEVRIALALRKPRRDQERRGRTHPRLPRPRGGGRRGRVGSRPEPGASG